MRLRPTFAQRFRQWRRIYADNGTYVGADTTALKLIDSGLSSAVVTNTLTASSYCIGANVNGKTWSVQGPGATKWDNTTVTCTGAGTTP